MPNPTIVIDWSDPLLVIDKRGIAAEHLKAGQRVKKNEQSQYRLSEDPADPVALFFAVRGQPIYVLIRGKVQIGDDLIHAGI